MAQNRVAGTAWLKVDSKQYPLRGKWKSKVQADKREGIAGQDAVHGYKEMPRVPTSGRYHLHARFL